MAIVRKPGAKVNKELKQTFKQNAKYEWPPEEKFVILGIELDSILKALQAAADTPEFKRDIAIYEGLKISNNIFKESVEQGLILEVVPPKKSK